MTWTDGVGVEEFVIRNEADETCIKAHSTKIVQLSKPRLYSPTHIVAICELWDEVVEIEFDFRVCRLLDGHHSSVLV